MKKLNAESSKIMQFSLSIEEIDPRIDRCKKHLASNICFLTLAAVFCGVVSCKTEGATHWTHREMGRHHRSKGKPNDHKADEDEVGKLQPQESRHQLQPGADEATDALHRVCGGARAAAHHRAPTQWTIQIATHSLPAQLAADKGGVEQEYSVTTSPKKSTKRAIGDFQCWEGEKSR